VTTFTAGTGRSSEHVIPTSSICGRSFSVSAEEGLVKALRTTSIGFARSRRLAGQRPGFHTSLGGLPHSTSMRSQLAISTRRLRRLTDSGSLRSVRNSNCPSSSIAMNRCRDTTSTNWLHDIGPRDTSPEGSSSVCSPFRGMGSGPARLRRFLARAETPSPDGSIKGSAEKTMTRDSLRGSTYSIQGSLDDDNGAMVNVAPIQYLNLLHCLIQRWLWLVKHNCRKN